MKTGALIILNVAVAAAVVAGARFLLPAGQEAGTAAGRIPRDGAPRDAELRDRVAALEGRLEELSAALDRQREAARATAEAAKGEVATLRREVAEERKRADAAEVLLAGSGAVPAEGPEEKKPDLDAFARQFAQSMRKGLGQEFKRIADLVTNPTPEALELRRNQLKFFANAMGTQAGLDRAQIETLERILNDTDEKARNELRPLLVGAEDPKDLDYKRLKEVTTDSFAAQDRRFEEEFPREKADRVKAQMDPLRSLFTAMLDDLEKQAAEPKQE